MRIHTILKSPIGPLFVEVEDDRLTRLERIPEKTVTLTHSDHPTLTRLEEELKAYFQGECKTFTVPTRSSGTEFEREVYAALRRIPYGETRSYLDIAKAIGRPKAARAVGQACGKNPLLLVIPCHRVIASNGTMGGFRLSLDIKAQLLKLEKTYRPT